MKSDSPHILLVNPWIHDFAAYDYWARPMGLALLGSILRNHGFTVSYIDCLDHFHPEAVHTDMSARCGRGPWLKTRIPKPDGIKHIPRNFCRYGILPEWFAKDLQAVDKPDLILLTSLMTYWYPGVQETIAHIRKIFPDVPLVLGGIYATLCHEHALRHSGADEVISGDGIKEILRIAEQYTGFSVSAQIDPSDMNTWPFPAWDLQRQIPFAPLLTSMGCPFSCAYCASRFLEPVHMVRSPEHVLAEILHWHKTCGVRDFAFYDDALLINAKNHAIPMLEGIIRADMPLRFHTPNAVHIREITPQTAQLMFRAGFKTLRLGLETTAFEERNALDRKVTEEEFCRAAAYLREAGFDQKQVGAYLLVGLPHQSLEAVEASILTVKRNGLTPVPTYYTPIPHTALWKEAVAVSSYNLEADPVFSNNALFPCMSEGFSWKLITRLKDLVTHP